MLGEGVRGYCPVDDVDKNAADCDGVRCGDDKGTVIPGGAAAVAGEVGS